MPGRLDDKVAIVTGGGAGFGRAIVRKFVAEGAGVLIWDIDRPSAESVSSSLPFPNSSVAFTGDVSKLDDWQRALSTVLETFGSLDIVVNNAGVVHRAQPSHTIDEGEVDRMWNINVKPLYYSAHVMIPYFKQQGKGLFLNLSSISAPRPRPNLVWYAASKSAVTAVTRGLAAEYAKDNVRCNCLQPVLGDTGMVANVLGGTDTPEGRKIPVAGIPLGRLSQPEDIANAAAFLASDEASFLTGVCLDVDGGRSLM